MISPRPHLDICHNTGYAVLRASDPSAGLYPGACPDPGTALLHAGAASVGEHAPGRPVSAAALRHRLQHLEGRVDRLPRAHHAAVSLSLPAPAPATAARAAHLC